MTVINVTTVFSHKLLFFYLSFICLLKLPTMCKCKIVSRPCYASLYTKSHQKQKYKVWKRQSTIKASSKTYKCGNLKQRNNKNSDSKASWKKNTLTYTLKARGNEDEIYEVWYYISQKYQCTRGSEVYWKHRTISDTNTSVFFILWLRKFFHSNCAPIFLSFIKYGIFWCQIEDFMTTDKHQQFLALIKSLSPLQLHKSTGIRDWVNEWGLFGIMVMVEIRTGIIGSTIESIWSPCISYCQYPPAHNNSSSRKTSQWGVAV